MFFLGQAVALGKNLDERNGSEPGCHFKLKKVRNQESFNQFNSLLQRGLLFLISVRTYNGTFQRPRRQQHIEPNPVLESTEEEPKYTEQCHV